MAITYTDIIPSPISNTTIRQSFNNGVAGAYVITPISGYVLHDNTRDWTEPVEVEDEYGNIIEQDVSYLGYTRGSATCGPNYNFTTNPREFYAVPEDSVPADQIFGGGNNDHEVM